MVDAERGAFLTMDVSGAPRLALVERGAFLTMDVSGAPRLALGGHGRVRISDPVSVTRMVCSNWAVCDLSFVVTVHPSDHTS